MAQKRTMKRYIGEFKEEAVALVNNHGYSVAKAAEAVSVSPAMLYKRKNELETQACGTALSLDEREELKKTANRAWWYVTDEGRKLSEKTSRNS